MTAPTLEDRLEAVLQKRSEMPWLGSDELAYLGGHMAQYRFLKTAFAVLEREEMAIRAEMKGEVKREIVVQAATVVNFKDIRNLWDDKNRRWLDDNIVYIGRGLQGTNLPRSIWANPFRISEDTDALRWKSVHDFGDYLLGSDELMAQIETLRGKTLCCHCKPRRCHGDVLVELLKESVPHATP